MQAKDNSPHSPTTLEKRSETLSLQTFIYVFFSPLQPGCANVYADVRTTACEQQKFCECNWKAEITVAAAAAAEGRVARWQKKHHWIWSVMPYVGYQNTGPCVTPLKKLTGLVTTKPPIGQLVRVIKDGVLIEMMACKVETCTRYRSSKST